MNDIHKLHQRRKVLTAGIALLALGGRAPTARAQAYPTRPVTIVVPFPAGSAADNAARVVGRELQATLGQPFVIDNKAGAQGAIGTAFVARSAPDGYTMVLAAISFVAAVSEMKDPQYDPVKDFDPVVMIGTLPLALMVRPDFPAKDLPEFIAHLRNAAKPLSAGYGSSSSRVAIAQLRTRANVQVVEVPYRGIPLAVNDLMAGVTDFTFADLGNAMAQAKSGKLRAIAVAGAQRSPLVPDWPTLAEYLPGYDVAAWVALAAPAGTPGPIAQRVHDATVAALKKPEVIQTLATTGITPIPMSREEAKHFISREVVRWAEMNRAAGILPQ